MKGTLRLRQTMNALCNQTKAMYLYITISLRIDDSLIVGSKTYVALCVQVLMVRLLPLDSLIVLFIYVLNR